MYDVCVTPGSRVFPLSLFGLEAGPPVDMWSRDLKTKKHLIPICSSLHFQLHTTLFVWWYRIQHLYRAATLLPTWVWYIGEGATSILSMTFRLKSEIFGSTVSHHFWTRVSNENYKKDIPGSLRWMQRRLVVTSSPWFYILFGWSYSTVFVCTVTMFNLGCCTNPLSCWSPSCPYCW